MERISLVTYDEVELAANLYLPEGVEGWSPAVIVCHGFGSRKENYADFGERAALAGVASLILDLRGHGESGGEVDSNIFNDVAAALLYLQGRPDINPMSIGIRGSSFGSWLAIHTAAHLPDISSVVAFCPTTETLFSIILEEVGMVQRGHPSDLVRPDLPRVNVNSMAQLLMRVDINTAIERISPRPLLLVHCEGDEVVPSHVSNRLYDSAAEPKTLWLLPGGDHGSAQHDPEIDGRLLEWMRMSRPNSGDLGI